jgi:hypothetical protein
LSLQPVLEPHAKVQLLIFKAKIIKKKENEQKNDDFLLVSQQLFFENP